MPARVVATLEDACAAVEQAADAMGLATRRLTPRAAGDAEQAASRYAHELALGTEDVLLWGGETTVQLPPEPGRGGRSQHFALAAARLLAGHDDLVLLAAGTDGSDGNSDDAGAIVDGGTLARGRSAGLDADASLAGADAGRFLEASGDLLHTGPTGTNVGDLVLGLRRPPQLHDEADDGEARED
jgi:hydroxypyruvate reductase